MAWYDNYGYPFSKQWGIINDSMYEQRIAELNSDIAHEKLVNAAYLDLIDFLIKKLDGYNNQINELIGAYLDLQDEIEELDNVFYKEEIDDLTSDDEPQIGDDEVDDNVGNRVSDEDVETEERPLTAAATKSCKSCLVPFIFLPFPVSV